MKMMGDDLILWLLGLLIGIVIAVDCINEAERRYDARYLKPRHRREPPASYGPCSSDYRRSALDDYLLSRGGPWGLRP